MTPTPPSPSTVASFASRLLLAETLDVKLAPPAPGVTDDDRGPPLRLLAPGRPAALAISPGRVAKTPRPIGMGDPAQRRRILHSLANHELQAAELFAWALLAFPHSEPAFRRGCLGILSDEQRHCAAYIARLESLGGQFGDYAVNGHFWRRMAAVETPLQFVCAMGLTFENANLDFALELATQADRCGDTATAAVLRMVHDDEIAHVAFAYDWLLRWKADDATAFESFAKALTPPLAPSRARGATFDPTSRERAGLDADFIEQLAATTAEGPGGARR